MTQLSERILVIGPGGRCYRLEPNGKQQRARATASSQSLPHFSFGTRFLKDQPCFGTIDLRVYWDESADDPKRVSPSSWSDRAAIHTNSPAMIAIGIRRSQKFVPIRRSTRPGEIPCSLS